MKRLYFNFNTAAVVTLVVVLVSFTPYGFAQSNTSYGAGSMTGGTDKFNIQSINVTNHGSYQFPTINMGSAQGNFEYSDMYIYDGGLEYYGYFATTSSSISPVITGGLGSGATLDFYLSYYDDSAGLYYFEIYTNNYGNGYGPEVTITGGDGQASAYYSISGGGNLYIGVSTLVPYSTVPNVNISSGGATAVAILSGTAANGNNTAIGYQAFSAVSSGKSNTGIGSLSGQHLTTGSNNTFIGDQAGKGISTGNNNTILGRTSSNLSANLSNTVMLNDGNGNNRFYSSPNGNALIGYGNSPVDNGFRLDVNGNSRINGDINSTRSRARMFTFLDFNGSSEHTNIMYAPSTSRDLEFRRILDNNTNYPTDLVWSRATGVFDFKQIPTINGVHIQQSLGYIPYNPASYPINPGGETLQSTASRGNTFLDANNPANKFIGVGKAMTDGDATFIGWRYNYGDSYGYVETYSGVKPLVLQRGNPGRVLIGITTDNGIDKLQVNGSIKAKAVKVDPNAWPDYVFEPSYELRSLDQTAQFIKANKHLPEIPSAKDVETNGIDLGAMNALLLKKIEELTLYLIEKDQEIKVLKNIQEEVNGQLKLIMSRLK